MKKNNIIYFTFFFLLSFKLSFADDFNLTLKSKVELRNWKLSSKAYKQETFLQGASIELYKVSGLVSKTTSDKDGNFEINIPTSGNYTLMITREGYNPKQFIVNSKSIPIKGGTHSIPSVDMTGFIGSKTIKGVGDVGLNQPIIKADYNVSNKNELLKYSVNHYVNMNDAEYRVIQKFCTCNKLGDIAMQDKNYALAKTYYLMAIDIIPAEEYSKEQLKKADEGLKLDDLKRRETTKKPKTKSKAIASKQTVSAKPTKSADFKNSAGSGKATRKTRRTLGK